MSRDEYFRDNLDATAKLIEAEKKANVKKWVFYSTVSVLGPSDEALDEDVPYNPVIPYGESKAEAEKLIVNQGDEIENCEILVIAFSDI